MLSCRRVKVLGTDGAGRLFNGALGAPFFIELFKFPVLLRLASICDRRMALNFWLLVCVLFLRSFAILFPLLVLVRGIWATGDLGEFISYY